MKKGNLLAGIIILLLTAISSSSYLFYKHIHTTGPDACSTIFGKGCDTALNSRFSELWGLSMGGWGIIYYLAIFLLLAMPYFFGSHFSRATKRFIFLLSFVAVLAGIFFIGLMITQPALFCPFCTLIHLTNFLLFFLFMQLNKMGFRQFWTDTKEMLVSSSFRKALSSNSIWKISGFVITGFLLASAYLGLHTLSTPNTMVTQQELMEIIAAYDKNPVQKITVNSKDPTFGDSTKPIKLIIFSDFYCPGCRMFTKEVDSTRKNFATLCYIVFKQFPLNTSCNPSLKTDLHPQACETARAAVAAGNQGKFWPFHDQLFKTSPKIDLLKAASEAGLNMATFEADRSSKEVLDLVQKNITEGIRLAIDETPTVFLNGKRVPDLRPGVLKYLILMELQKRTMQRNKP